MQINRLFEIVFLLLDKKTMTAKELSQRFAVSPRTIYRDIETLSGSGIPVYMSKGRGGGIRLLDNFVLNKSVLSESEQDEILSALHGLNALHISNGESALTKLGALFNKSATDWIDIDFSYWGSDGVEKEKFNLLKNAILSKNEILFDYFAPPGCDVAKRTAEPLQIYFKEKSWYLKAYCTTRQDYRTFKLTRMRHIELTDRTYSRELPRIRAEDFSERDLTKIVLKFTESAWNRVYDELYGQAELQQNEDELIATMYCPEDEWIYGYILSYGADAVLLEPAHIREILKQKLQQNLEQYL